VLYYWRTRIEEKQAKSVEDVERYAGPM
jgi:hypothetical protein